MFAEAVTTADRFKKIVARHKAYCLSGAELLGERTGDNVDFIKTRARDNKVARFDVSQTQHLSTRAAPENKTHIKRMEPISNGWVVINNVQVVVRGKCPGERVTDFATAYENNPHRLTQIPFWHPR